MKGEGAALTVEILHQGDHLIEADELSDPGSLHQGLPAPRAELCAHDRHRQPLGRGRERVDRQRRRAEARLGRAARSPGRSLHRVDDDPVVGRCAQRRREAQHEGRPRDVEGEGHRRLDLHVGLGNRRDRPREDELGHAPGALMSAVGSTRVDWTRGPCVLAMAASVTAASESTANTAMTRTR